MATSTTTRCRRAPSPPTIAARRRRSPPSPAARSCAPARCSSPPRRARRRCATWTASRSARSSASRWSCSPRSARSGRSCSACFPPAPASSPRRSRYSLVDGELHLVTLAFGASLIGEAIDYAILFCAAHLAAGNRWTPQVGVAQVRPALTVAVATSLLAYALLGLLPFPGVSQVARFALVGLAVAYLSVQWLLPGLLTQPSRRDPLAATGWAARLLERWSGVLSGKRAVVIAALALAACVPGWMALQPNDDVRLLVPRQPELALQDAAIRATTGFDAGSALLPGPRDQRRRCSSQRNEFDQAAARAGVWWRARRPSGGKRLRPAARGPGSEPRTDAEACLRRSRRADAHADRGRLPPRGGQGAAGRVRSRVPAGDDRRLARVAAVDAVPLSVGARRRRRAGERGDADRRARRGARQPRCRRARWRDARRQGDQRLGRCSASTAHGRCRASPPRRR